MPEEGFLRRWARVKASGADAVAEAPPPAPAAPSSPAPAPAFLPGGVTPWSRAGDTQVAPAAPAGSSDAAPAGEPDAAGRPSPTLEDVARLTPDSDYSIFVGKGVDKSVQRLALKKLFADPHFNVPDRLDMYMDDYNIPSPVSEEMLASLDHARSALRRVVEEAPAAVPAPAADAIPGNGDALARSAGPDASAAPPANAPDAIGHDAVPHNEAAQAPAAHQDSLPGDIPGGTPSCAPTHDHGPFHRPNQHLPQGQA